MWFVWSSHVEMLACVGFRRHYLRCILCPWWNGQHMWRSILCIPWHRKCLINTSCDTFWVLAYIGRIKTTNWDASCVLPGMGGIWSTYVEMHFMFLLAWVWFGHISWYSFSVLVGMCCVWSKFVEVLSCPRWHEIGLVNTCWYSLYLRWQGRSLVNTWDAICVVTGVGRSWSTLVEMLFVSSMAWEGFGQHMARCIFVLNILCSRWHMRVWSTNVEIHFMYSLA